MTDRNPKGERIARQTKGDSTVDQGGKALGTGLDQKGGPHPHDREPMRERQLRQGTPDTEESEP